MKKVSSLFALVAIATLSAQAQENFAGYFLLEGKTIAFAKPATASYIAAYSSPQGGQVIKEESACAAGKPILWNFEEGKPAFLLLRPVGQTAANVVPLEMPLFSLSHVEASTGLLPGFSCVAMATEKPVELQIRRWNANGSSEIVETYAFTATESPIHFQTQASKANGVYEAYIVSQGTELWKSVPFGGDELTTKLLPFPNPTRNGQFALFAPAGGTVILKDIKGSTILVQSVKEGPNTLSLPAALSAGVYTGQFTSEGAKETQLFRLSYIP